MRTVNPSDNVIRLLSPEGPWSTLRYSLAGRRLQAPPVVAVERAVQVESKLLAVVKGAACLVWRVPARRVAEHLGGHRQHA